MSACCNEPDNWLPDRVHWINIAPLLARPKNDAEPFLDAALPDPHATSKTADAQSMRAIAGAGPTSLRIGCGMSREYGRPQPLRQP
jgi:hypothetical protein